MTPHTNKPATLSGVRGRIIYSRDPEHVVDLADGVLVWDERGAIVACEAYEVFARCGMTATITHCKNRLIIPGLVDCHIHLPQLDERGRHGATLIDWLNRYILPAEKSFADAAVAHSVGARFFKKLILNGTTTAAVYSSVHEAATDHAFELARVAGVRAIIGKVMMDQNAPPDLVETTSASIEASARLCEKWHGKEGGRLRYAFTPRFAPTCSESLWRETAQLVRATGAYLQSHVAETREENALVARMHPQFADYVALFENTGAAGPRTILAHAIYLSDDEFRRMAATGIKVAHCPTSNFFLKSGSMPAARVEAAGVVYGLGTDVGAGTSMSLFSEMRHADYAQRDCNVSPQKAFYLATFGGARVLSMEGEIGSFEPQKYADFCVVDIAQIDTYYDLAAMNTTDLLSLLMYRGDGHVIESTHVAGRRLNVDIIK